MYQAIDRNSPFLGRRSLNPGSPRGSLVETMSLAQSATAAPSAPVVAAICAAEILGLAGFSIVPALLPQFLVANQHASRLARGDYLGRLYARGHPFGQPDRSPARSANLSRL